MASRPNSSFTRRELSTFFHPLAGLVHNPSGMRALDGAAFWTLLLDTLLFAHATQPEETRISRQHNESSNRDETGEANLPAASSTSAPNVETLRRDLQQQEHKLAADHARIERGLAQMRNVSIAQAEVTILCGRGEHSGGRVSVHNPLGETTDVNFVVVYGSGNPPAGVVATIEPSCMKIPADEVAVVRLAVEVAAEFEPRAVRFRVEARSGDRCLSICWVELRLVGEVGGIE